MQTCWPNHHQHPWFVSPTLKRKLSAEEDQPDGEQQRRKRLHKLERGFAELTLHRASASPDLPASTSVIHPNSIEEPQDIKMSSGSWYEPEKDRIIITQLDDSDDEQVEEQNARAQFTISPALLSVLNKRLGIGSDIPSKQPASQALILFQPRDHTPPTSSTPSSSSQTVVESAEDSDPMEVELF